MGLTGKYDFKGIKRLGARGLEAALGSTGWGAALLRLPVLGTLTHGILELFVNWLANEGLLVLNLAAISVTGEWNQHEFDAALDDALKQIELSGGRLTPAQAKEIDDKVIAAARRFIVIGTPAD